MATALREMLSDSAVLALTSSAVATAAYASFRANDALWKQRATPGRLTLLTSTDLLDDHTHVLQGDAALVFPIIATLSLVLLFFFLRSIGAVFTALSTVSGFFALLFTLWPFAEFFSKRLPSRWTASANALQTATTIVALPPAIVVVISWLLTGHWLPNNILGISLCILFATICKVPNLKVATMLFCGLFVYDIFFVFFSEHIFGRNVMVEVATTAPTNPASTLASWLHLPINPVKTLALPAKLMIPTSDGKHFAILGLGDIILPEVLLSYLLHFDLTHNSWTSLSSGYFIYALVAYLFAVMLSFYCNYAFRSAQPALLYIVPSVLLVTMAFALYRCQARALWLGSSSQLSNSRNDHTRQSQSSLSQQHSDSLVTPTSEAVSLLDDKSHASNDEPLLPQAV